jgi:hypothetical protein
MSSNAVTNGRKSGLKIKSAIKAGRITLNHNARPRRVTKLRTLTQNDVVQPRGGVVIKTGIRSGLKFNGK